jgi:threonine aldolase
MNTESMRVIPGFQFASDNTAGICPEAWAALSDANHGYAPSYGADRWTERACELIRKLFDRSSAQVFFVFNGTASNALSLAHLARGYHGIVCHEAAHVQSDECGAPEFFAGGAKLIALPGAGAKLSVDALRQLLATRDDLHFPRPRALTLSQSTEWGTFYRPQEIAALTDVAHRHDMLVHMDGARFANAVAASRNATPADLSWRSGVDVLSLGGTKNGLNTTEAVVFFDETLAHEFEYRCKQGGQLASKMRFQTCQWQAVLESGAWLRHAAHANAMAQRLGAAVSTVPGVKLARPVEVNAVFVEMSEALVRRLDDAGWHFHSMTGAGYRLMCCWATTEADIDAFVRDLIKLSLESASVS